MVVAVGKEDGVEGAGRGLSGGLWGPRSPRRLGSGAMFSLGQLMHLVHRRQAGK